MRTSIDSRIKAALNAEYLEESSEIMEKTKLQLSEYFAGIRMQFDLDLLLIGTDFQKEVWRNLQEIPFGKTNSYLELSRRMNNEKAIRAVATANGANAISIVIPCHRIIGSNGDLVGYAGGLEVKKKLLQIENSQEQLTLF
jgi:methylated-DNA-[protein]-cysteine S-methyltransferase